MNNNNNQKQIVSIGMNDNGDYRVVYLVDSKKKKHSPFDEKEMFVVWMNKKQLDKFCKENGIVLG